MSDGPYISLGYYEQLDVAVVVDVLKRHFGFQHVGIWGRSMGAVTGLLYATSLYLEDSAELATMQELAGPLKNQEMVRRRLARDEKQNQKWFQKEKEKGRENNLAQATESSTETIDRESTSPLINNSPTGSPAKASSEEDRAQPHQQHLLGHQSAKGGDDSPSRTPSGTSHEETVAPEPEPEPTSAAVFLLSDPSNPPKIRGSFIKKKGSGVGGSTAGGSGSEISEGSGPLEPIGQPTIFPERFDFPLSLEAEWVFPVINPPSLLILDSPFSDLITISKEFAKTWAEGRTRRGVVSRIANFSMKILRSSITKKTGVDISLISPLSRLEKTPLRISLPVLFIHGKGDDFVSPRHSMLLFNAYKIAHATAEGEDSIKKLILVDGGHNCARSADAFTNISQIIFDRMISTAEKELYGWREPVPVFGRTHSTTAPDESQIKNFMVRRIPCCSKSPPTQQIFPLVMSVRRRSHLTFLTPFFETIEGVIPLADLQRVWIDSNQDDILVLQLKDHAHQRHFGAEYHGHSAYVLWTTEASTILHWIRECFLELQTLFSNEGDQLEESSSNQSLEIPPAETVTPSSSWDIVDAPLETTKSKGSSKTKLEPHRPMDQPSDSQAISS